MNIPSRIEMDYAPNEPKGINGKLIQQLAEIEKMWMHICQNKDEGRSQTIIDSMIDKLSCYQSEQYPIAIGNLASAMQFIFQSFFNRTDSIRTLVNDNKHNVEKLLFALEESIHSLVTLGPEINSTHDDNIRVLYIAVCDINSLVELACELSKCKYHLFYFSKWIDLDTVCRSNLPLAILLDNLFWKSENINSDKLSKFYSRLNPSTPIIIISDSDHFENRMAVARTSVYRFFPKPINFGKLIRSLEEIINKPSKKPYHILVIDDDATLLKLYSVILQGGGMRVDTISDPSQSIDALYKYKPDVLVLDAHMSKCSGLELSKMIRQDDTWKHMPILLISSDMSADLQLEAIKAGVDDFLSKPINSELFLTAITQKVNRAQTTKRINHNFETLLRESEFQLTALNQHDIVSITNVSGKITYVNDKFCNVSGFSRNELLGENHRILKSNHHPYSFYQDMWKTISQGKVWHGIICNYRKNGTEYWVESSIVPFIDAKRKPYKYVSVRTDITALRVSEERLLRSQSFANIGTWDWNIRTGELYWSDCIGTLFGYKNKVPETTYNNFLTCIHPEDRQSVIDAVEACVNKGAKYNIEHRVVWPDGTIRWMQESGNVKRSETGDPLNMLGVVQDITEKVKAKQALIEAREAAEEADSAKSQFLSSMSHELRTPLNAILGFGQLLKMEAEINSSLVQLDNIDEIIKAGSHLLELINEVLDLSKIESGHFDLSIEPVLLGEVVVEVLNLVLPLAQKNEIEIRIILNDSEIPIERLSDQQKIVYADRVKLKQALLNLLSNAVKYNIIGGKIAIHCKHFDSNMLRVCVTDTGPGLTTEQQSKLFTAFNRLGAEQTEIEGAGIGLVITKKIVELMGGSIGVQSEVKKGSTFWIELPSDALPLEKVHMSSMQSDHQSKPNSVIEKTHKLVYIEDNPANLRLVSQLISRFPHIHMWNAHEPYLGIELALEHKPDLILVDINLPGIDGFEVLKQLRRNKITKNTPIIAVSANAMPRDITKSLEAGFNDYITKPIDIISFMETVNTALQINSEIGLDRRGCTSCQLKNF